MPPETATDCPSLVHDLREASDAEREACAEACALAAATADDDPRLPRGTAVARILVDLGLDAEAVTAALLADPRLRETPERARLLERLGGTIPEMVAAVDRLNNFRDYDEAAATPEQTERMRRLLLSMTSDLRVMLIKLAYRLERLRVLPADDFEIRKRVARETLDLYAPLANRLGVAQLKWELEDLAFRYLEPQTYRRIARLLDAKRDEREAFIGEVIESLETTMAEAGIDCRISGRSKHIFSIWNKMRRKQLDFDQLFDLSAVRIYVEHTRECYAALGVVHSLWTPVKGEFDDYIAQPKPNGYQSLHTAVFGPGGKVVEIQIRTRAMHEAAEYGIASHWRYKEGGGNADAGLENAIAGLRRLLENPAELPGHAGAELDLDRIYVFTPSGELMELQRGATPLDFAYAIHTQVGHGCRGAKVNGRIVPLTHELHTGDRVEILTEKNGEPRRNWLNPHFGYVHTARARTKIRNWFNHVDRRDNIREGRQILDRELRRLDLSRKRLPAIRRELGCEDPEKLHEELGRGNIGVEQIARAAQRLLEPETTGTERPAPPTTAQTRRRPAGDDVHIEGVGNLKTQMAGCCNPLPGDPIIGYITRGKGVTVHRQDCPTVLAMPESEQARLIRVDWSGEAATTYPVEVAIEAFDRQGLLRDITNLLSGEKVNLVAANTRTEKADQSVRMTLKLEIRDLSQLSRVLDRIEQLPNVADARRLK